MPISIFIKHSAHWVQNMKYQCSPQVTYASVNDINWTLIIHIPLCNVGSRNKNTTRKGNAKSMQKIADAHCKLQSHLAGLKAVCVQFQIGCVYSYRLVALIVLESRYGMWLLTFLHSVTQNKMAAPISICIRREVSVPSFKLIEQALKVKYWPLWPQWSWK